MHFPALPWMRAGALALLAVQGCGPAAEATSGEGSQLAQESTSEPDLSRSAPSLPVTVTVNAAANQHPISPEIYGVASATPAQLADLNLPLHRSGGNHTSRYNWKLNAFNRASDWYFESIPEISDVPGENGDTFIATSRGAGAQPMLTVPILGWVAKLGPGRSKLASFSISKYGAQTDRDWQWLSDAGNGIRTSGQYVTGNDPADANTVSAPALQQEWVQHLVTQWGTASAGGLRYYILDNEPSLWHATHRDVHPTGATMEEVRDRMLDYGAAVKAVDPGALLVGPEEWGWSGYLYSGYDQQYAQRNGYPPPSSLPDRAAHGGWDYLPWLLNQLRENSIGTGRRALDVLSVHYYPQGGEYSNNTTQAMQLLRNRSTRSLWDASYVDESWIATPVQLIPRLRGWVNAYYPGTRTAITEYSWGAEDHINGATAQADLLGIFGREGLDMAVRWGTPASTTPTYKAIKLYRNYDGQRSTFGDVSVSTAVPAPDTLSAFSALRSSDGALTVMVVCKSLSNGAALTLDMAGFAPGGPAQVWQLTSANTLTRKADIPLSGMRLFASLPATSVTLLVIPPLSH